MSAESDEPSQLSVDEPRVDVLNAVRRDQLRAALAIRRDALGHHPLVADMLVNLGGIAMHDSRYEDQLRYSSQAREIYAAFLGERASKTLATEHARGLALRGLGRYEQAEQVFRDVLARQREVPGERHPSLARVLESLGRLLLATDRPAQAIEPLELALALTVELVESGGGDPETAPAEVSLRAALESARAPAAPGNTDGGKNR